MRVASFKKSHTSKLGPDDENEHEDFFLFFTDKRLVFDNSDFEHGGFGTTQWAQRLALHHPIQPTLLRQRRLQLSHVAH